VIANAFLRRYYHYPNEMYDSIGDLDVSSLKIYFDKFIKDISIKGIFLGNLLEEDALKMGDKII